MSTQAQPTRQTVRIHTFLHACLFVLGFTFVFVIGWGGAATLLGNVLNIFKDWIGRIGGVIIILFGLHTVGWLKIPWLDIDTRPDWAVSSQSGYLASGLMGVVFAAGWTPCIGTILGAILTLGLSQSGSGHAMLLASGYAIGLGIPFLLISLLLDRAFVVTRWLSRYTRHIQILSGLMLIMMGVLLLSNTLFYIAIWAQRLGLYFDPSYGQTGVPTYGIAIVAGLLSFLSPCVLPLVPAYIGYLSGRATGIQTS